MLRYSHAATIALIAITALSSCGRKDDGDKDAGVAAPAEATPPPSEAPAVAATPPPSSAAPDETKAQLGDETVGVKNGEQLISHYSLMTGVKFEEMDENQRNEVLRLKQSLPLDNAAGKFNSAHVLAATKLATTFCNEFLRREQDARSNPQTTFTAKLPDLDWNSNKFPKEIARPVYAYFVEIFWGVDVANQPAKTAWEPELDALIDALAVPMAAAEGQQPQPIGLRGSALALCVTVASSFSSLEL